MARYYWNEISVLPDDLIAFAWSAPLRDLAAKVDISDVGLRKQLLRYGIPMPPQGYWNKILVGKPVPKRPHADPRLPGGTGRVRVDPRFHKVIEVAKPISSSGPFESEVTPENVDALLAQELKAIGQVSVKQSLERPHVGLVEVLKSDEKRRLKFQSRNWSSDRPYFETAFPKRVLRLLNALFGALSKRGHSGDAYVKDGEIHASAQIGDTYLGLSFVFGKAGQRQQLEMARDLPATTPLTLQLDRRFDGRNSQAWKDSGDKRLEDQIAEIAASLIVAGEVKFRALLKENEARVEEARLREEKLRQEKLDKANSDRLDDLKKSGELLRQASDIRLLVRQVRESILEGTKELPPEKLKEWERWALGEADKIDPILSRQFMSHVEKPELDDF